MKSKKEIEQLAKELCNIPIGLVIDEEERYYKNFQKYDGIILGYNQCQQDMADEWFEYPKNTPLVHSENYLVFVDGYIEIDLFRGDHNKFNSELYNKNCTITHWKTLPNKPLNKQD